MPNSDCFFVGLDVHQRTSTCCVLDAHGERIETRTVKGHWTNMVRYLASLGKPVVVAFEASVGYGAIHDALAGCCRRVVVAHPGRLRLIFNTKRKNDRVDARKLAKLLYLDEVPEAHVPTVDVRQWRQLIEQRRSTIEKRTRCKNGLKAILRGEGIVKPRGVGGQWTKRGRAWLAEVELPGHSALRRDLLIEELESLDRQIKRLTDELDRVGQDHPGVVLLRTIPGVGPRTAEAIVAYLDDPHRFARTRQVGAYLGLVPKQDASGNVNRLGHLTKEGPATARKLLVEAAWRSVDRCPAMATAFRRLGGGRRDRRKQAIVAIAHKLGRTMLAMLKTGEAYQPAAA